ncbi:MAG: signal recognition particle protein Srp54 [Pyrobaculum sp.]
MKALTEAFSKLIEKIRGAEYIDESTLQELSREIQRSLLKADVPIDLVKAFTDGAIKRIREEKPPAGIPPREYLIYILYEELVKLLGGEKAAEFKPAKKPYVVLLIGVEGSGKTTTAAKLARYLMKRGYRVGLVETDTLRPAAFDQLKQLAERIGAPFYGERDSRDAVQTAVRGVQNFSHLDIIIVDTAGRHRNEEALLQEVSAIYSAIRPDEVTLVIDATMGKLAAAQAEAFMKYLSIHSVIITKMDSTARGGGALAAVGKTNARVKFIGVGEDVDELEAFDARKFVARLLGMGDVEALVEKIRAVFEEEKVLEEIESGRFDLLLFKKQIEGLARLGPLSKVFQLLPAGVKISEEQMELSERNIKKWRAILSSMTREELKNPEVLNASRIRRIALGAGVTPRDVKEMLTTYENLKRMSKTLKRQLRFRIR